jgi:hypothetical protein
MLQLGVSKLFSQYVEAIVNSIQGQNIIKYTIFSCEETAYCKKTQNISHMLCFKVSHKLLNVFTIVISNDVYVIEYINIVYPEVPRLVATG